MHLCSWFAYLFLACHVIYVALLQSDETLLKNQSARNWTYCQFCAFNRAFVYWKNIYLIAVWFFFFFFNLLLLELNEIKIYWTVPMQRCSRYYRKDVYRWEISSVSKNFSKRAFEERKNLLADSCIVKIKILAKVQASSVPVFTDRVTQYEFSKVQCSFFFRYFSFRCWKKKKKLAWIYFAWTEECM